MGEVKQIPSLKRRIHYLDSARGLAAFSVVGSHFYAIFGMPAGYEFLSNTPFHIFFHGDGAVRFFFVLSGYILSSRLAAQITTIDNALLLRYTISRIFRIYPLFIVTLLLSVCYLLNYNTEVLVLKNQFDWINSLWQQEITLKEILKQSLLIIDFSNSSERIIPQDWTLSIEVLISLLIPFLLMIIRYSKTLTVLIFTFITIKFLGLSSFCFDFILGILIMNNQEWIEQLWRKTTLIYKILILITSILVYTSDFMLNATTLHLLKDFLINITSIACAAFLIIVISSETVKKILEINFLVFIGNISYGIYLTHLLILVAFAPYIANTLNAMGLPEGIPTLLLTFTLTSILIVLVSYVLNKTIELPFINLGKRVSLKLLSLLKY